MKFGVDVTENGPSKVSVTYLPSSHGSTVQSSARVLRRVDEDQAVLKVRRDDLSRVDED